MLVPPTTVDFSIVLCYICFSLLYEPALYIDNDRHSDVMVISQSTDKKFGTPKKLLNTCIPNTRFILLSITAKSAITVVVGAQPHDSYLLKQIWKKFKQSKRDTRVHIIEAIDSLKAALKERFGWISGVTVRRSINFFNISPIKWLTDIGLSNMPCDEEFDLCLSGVENLNRNCQVFPAEHTCFMVGTLCAIGMVTYIVPNIYF